MIEKLNLSRIFLLKRIMIPKEDPVPQLILIVIELGIRFPKRNLSTVDELRL